VFRPHQDSIGFGIFDEPNVVRDLVQGMWPWRIGAELTDDSFDTLAETLQTSGDSANFCHSFLPP
jgi:hypothetical protein